MHRLAFGLGVSVFVVATLALLGAAGAVALSGKRSAGRVTVVNVTAGKPSELAFKLSKSSSLPVGTVTFKVTNRGKLTHDFKLCTAAVKTSAKNSCKGVAVKRLAAGKTASLTVKLTKKGTYEYLCTVAGHAKAGMKGLIGVGVVVSPTANPNPVVSPPTPTTTKVTTTTPVPAETLIGDPAAGAAVWTSAGCASCHTMKAAGATGTVGPNLDNSMPGQDLVVQRVTNGINVMPAFGSQLSMQQIQNLAAYVYSSTHT